MFQTAPFRTIHLLLMISLGYIATDIYLPSLPILSVYFQVSDNQVQMTLFSYLLSFAFTPLVCGPLSDQIGRKKVILAGFFISILATLICIFAPNIEWLILARFIQGFGTGAILISARAIMSDLFTGKELAKQMSFMTMLMPLFLAIAPTLGGLLQENFSWQAVFIFLAGYMLIILLSIPSRSESLNHKDQKKLRQVFSNYGMHLNNLSFIAFGINFILPSIGFFAYITTSPFLFQEVIGLSPVEYGLLSLYVGGTILGIGYLNTKLIQFFPVTKLIYFGSSMAVLAGCLLLSFHLFGWVTPWTLLVPALIYFTSTPLCISNSASKSLSFVKSHFGAAAALLTTAQFLIGSASSLVFSLISDETFLPLAIAFIAVGILSLLNLSYAARLQAIGNTENPLASFE